MNTRQTTQIFWRHPYILKDFESLDVDSDSIIKRTKKDRKLYNHDKLVDRLRVEFPAYDYLLFDDAQMPPSMLDIVEMFYRATVIIGPHGAGFSNMIVSRPGTVIIEYNAMGGRHCFTLTAASLGLRYFGTVTNTSSTVYGPVYANVTDAIEIIRRFA